MKRSWIKSGSAKKNSDFKQTLSPFSSQMFYDCAIHLMYSFILWIHPACPSPKKSIESVLVLFFSSLKIVMEKERQKDRGRGCPPGPERKQVLFELGKFTFLFKFKVLYIELTY